VVGAAILHRRRCLVAQRSESMPEPLRWEFPGGKVEAEETPRQALAREIEEELGLDVHVSSWLGRGQGMTHDRRPLVLDVYLASWPDGTPDGAVQLREHRRWGWFTAPEIDTLDWAAADIPVLAALKQRLAEP
jgi:8-oxo-dGTP diphosphatase